MFQENKICLGHCLAFLWPWLQKPTVKFFSILKCTGNRRSLNSFPEDSAAAAAKLLQSCPTLCDPRRQPTSLPRPWDSPGKNTGVGCHFLLQCMTVKSEMKSLSLARLFATSWTAAYQPPSSMGFSRQEYWSGVPLPSPS